MSEESRFKGPVVQDIDTTGLDVLYKVDFNVSFKEEKGILVVDDASRIIAIEKTLNYFKEHPPKRLIFISHLGKPKKELKKGKPKEQVRKELSLGPVAIYLTGMLGGKVTFVEDFHKEKIPGSGWIMLNNMRFDPREEEKDLKKREAYAKELCDLIDSKGVIVYDAFGAAHREHASSYDIMKYKKGKSYAGFLMQDEIKQLLPFTRPPEGAVAILAGAKIEDKIAHVRGFLEKGYTVLIGGGMAFTFYKALKKETGKSIVNPDMVKECEGLLSQYKKKLVLPPDAVITMITAKDKEGNDKKPNKLKKGDYTEPEPVDYDQIKPGYIGLDIEKKTIAEFQKIIAAATMVYWNGPVGVFEVPDFEAGTRAIGKAVEASTARKIAGGGETLTAIAKYGLKMPTSTGGGASSDFVVNGDLPGYKALRGEFK